MPRRLGDDPLARARSERAKAAEASATVSFDSGGQQGTTQMGIQPSSRPSRNDVFYRRKAGVVASQPAGDAAAKEVPEISEVSEIPEIREVAAAPASQAAVGVTADAGAAPGPSGSADAPVSPPASAIEEVPTLNGHAAGDASSTSVPVPEANDAHAGPSTAPQAHEDGGESQPQKSGGFFKRLFGKFK